MNYTMTNHNEIISVNSPKMIDMTSLNSIGILEYTNKEQYFNENLLTMTKSKDRKIKTSFYRIHNGKFILTTEYNREFY